MATKITSPDFSDIVVANVQLNNYGMPVFHLHRDAVCSVFLKVFVVGHANDLLLLGVHEYVGNLFEKIFINKRDNMHEHLFIYYTHVISCAITLCITACARAF